MTAQTVAAKLGGRPFLKHQVRSEMELAALVRAGLPVAALDYFVRWIAAGELYPLVGSPRTLQPARSTCLTAMPVPWPWSGCWGGWRVESSAEQVVPAPGSWVIGFWSLTTRDD
jgi:hypothetical protein